MTWIDGDLESSLAGALSLRPNLYRDFEAFAETFWRQPILDACLLEACRLRVAQLHHCEPEWRRRRPEAQAAGFSEQHAQALSHWNTSELFSDTQKSVLATAELFVQDPNAIDDDLAKAVTDDLGDAGFVALLEALAIFDGFCRFQCLLELRS